MIEAEKLARACAVTREAAEASLDWVAHPVNDGRMRVERPAMERAIRRIALEAGRLGRTAGRPMCVAAFGPSQNGKSYLMSALGSAGGGLTALFDGPRPELDFLREINPEGDKESTGIVCRFTLQRAVTPPHFPVALQLLTQADVVKILANAYCFDAGAAYKPPLAAADVAEHLAGFAGDRLAASDGLGPRDLWDIENYVQTYLDPELKRALAGSWDEIARLACGLPLPRRAELLSILWGRFAPLTAVFTRLVEALSALGFAEEAFCPLDALLPRERSIVNVSTLDGLSGEAGDALAVATRDGREVSLPRALVTALTAEARIVLKHSPRPFFAETDLLDFPGYRSRENYDVVRLHAEKPTFLIKELFLRGKVDYLFQRYVADQELTSIMLCIKSGPIEVTSIGPAIDRWVEATHGETPGQRVGRPSLLFFCLTWFDQHLVEKAGMGSDGGDQFGARLGASLLEKFGKSGQAWNAEWVPSEPFRNCFWIRNPAIKAKHVFQYEADREVAILDRERERIASLRAAHDAQPRVQAHFRDPGAAFDAAMEPGDGGVTRLAGALSEVCVPAVKARQIASRLAVLTRRLLDLLGPHHVSLDTGERREQRRAVFQTVAPLLVACDERSRLGSFIRRLGVETGALRSAIYRARIEAAARHHAEPPRATLRASAILDELFSDSAPAQPAPAARSSGALPDRAAAAAMQVWVGTLLGLVDDAVFVRNVGIEAAQVSEIVQELIGAARSAELETRIAAAIDAVVSATDSTELFTNKATIVAQSYIGRFASTFGAAGRDGEGLRAIGFGGAVRPVFAAAEHDDHPESLPAEPLDFKRRYLVDWVRALEDTMRAAAEGGGTMSPEERAQNEVLGVILAKLQPVDAGRLAG